MRQLATIQIIKNIRSIEGRDRIELATVLGYDIIVGKGLYENGEHIVFFEADSQFPKIDYWKEDLEKFKYRIKPFKVNTPNGPIYGQGWCVKLEHIVEYFKLNRPDIFNKLINTEEIKFYEGFEITDLLDITKYDPESIEEGQKMLAGNAEGNFPTYIIPKTDEIRLQNCMDVLEEIRGYPYVIRKKYDGTSVTFVKVDDKHRCCSRNLMIKNPIECESNIKSDYWNMYNKYPGIATLLDEGFAIQAEMYGEGIQKNPLGMTGKHIAVFNIYDIKMTDYVDNDDLEDLCMQYDLPLCSVVDSGEDFNYTFEQLQNLADSQLYDNGNLCEGIVIRPKFERYSKVLKGRISFKLISRPFLTK